MLERRKNCTFEIPQYPQQHRASEFLVIVETGSDRVDGGKSTVIGVAGCDFVKLSPLIKGVGHRILGFSESSSFVIIEFDVFGSTRFLAGAQTLKFYKILVTDI